MPLHGHTTVVEPSHSIEAERLYEHVYHISVCLHTSLQILSWNQMKTAKEKKKSDLKVVTRTPDHFPNSARCTKAVSLIVAKDDKFKSISNTTCLNGVTDS